MERNPQGEPQMRTICTATMYYVATAISQNQFISKVLSPLNNTHPFSNKRLIYVAYIVR